MRLPRKSSSSKSFKMASSTRRKLFFRSLTKSLRRQIKISSKLTPPSWRLLPSSAGGAGFCIVCRNPSGFSVWFLHLWVGQLHSFKSFSCNTYGPPRKCCKQKTYGLSKPFRCNTYKKHGGGAVRERFLHSTPSPIFRTLFQVPYPATPLFATLTKTPGCGGMLPILECAIRYFTTVAVPPGHCSTVPGAETSLRA